MNRFVLKVLFVVWFLVIDESYADLPEPKPEPQPESKPVPEVDLPEPKPEPQPESKPVPEVASNSTCDNPLGMESGKIANSQLWASTSRGVNVKRTKARLNHVGGWAAKYANANQWIKVDLLKPKQVTAIATQGRSNFDQWVKSYKLQYSLDDKTYTDYNGGQILTGNNDRSTVKKNILAKPIIARYIRLRPVTWNKWVSMRMELYGCEPVAANETSGTDVLSHECCRSLRLNNYCHHDLVMNDLCAKTCNVSWTYFTECKDVLSSMSCGILKEDDNCDASWVSGYCKLTCDQCTGS